VFVSRITSLLAFPGTGIFCVTVFVLAQYFQISIITIDQNRTTFRVLVGTHEGKMPLRGLSLYGKITLNLILKK
jgi:hypothetical protein